MVCPVELDHGEFWVVGGVHPFVAEVAVDLEDRFEASDDEPFEVELGGDAQVAIHTQGVVVGDEGSCVGASRDGVHHGSLHLQKAVIFEELADEADDAAAHDEDLAHFRIHDQIEIALAVAQLFVLETMVLFGQRDDRFGDEIELLDVEGELAGASDERVAHRLDDIAHFDELLDLFEPLLAKLILVEVDLYKTALVFDLRKGSFAHEAQEFDTAGESDADIWVLFLFELLDVGVAFKKLCVLDLFAKAVSVGVDPLFAKLLGFLDTLLFVLVVKYQCYCSLLRFCSIAFSILCWSALSASSLMSLPSFFEASLSCCCTGFARSSWGLSLMM